MTRLSDLLRGAADRAPIGEASVSIQKAHRRVRVQRGIRGAANGAAGVGAAALIFVGVINPTLSAGKAADENALSSAPPVDGGSREMDGPEVSSLFSDGWGECGSYLYTDSNSSGGDLSVSVEAGELLDLEGGSLLDIPTNLTAARDITITTPGPEAALLYEGLVVARFDADEAEQILDVVGGSAIDSTLTFPLVNCFDGSALPAAKYELVVSQAFNYATDEPEPTPIPEPTREPSPEPTIEPMPSPSVVDAPDLGTPDPAILEPHTGDMIPTEPGLWWEYRENAPSVTLTIAGEPLDDPFGDYLWSPPEKPEDILTPEKARELYEAGLVSGTWDMAPGTSRWIIPNYNYEETFSPESSRTGAGGWYGCSWDGTNGLGFPAESAVLDLMDVSVTFPSRINLSYGWVVDGNPQVHFAVTNTSEYSLPGLYDQPSRSLYLVKDGRVVAEAWPQDVRPYSNDVVFDQMAADADEYWGTLSPGAVITGDYLWRDVNGCWTENGPRSVASGTYTLLTSQSLHIDGSGEGYPVLYDGFDPSVVEKAEAGMPTLSMDPDENQDIAPLNSTIIDPYYTSDWVELQVWTSHGLVTITTS